MTSNLEVLLGPPGTGKTTALLQRLESELAGGTNPEDVAFVSFTRAAREEVLARVGRRFGIDGKDLPWLRTIHGTAYRLLNLAPDRVLDGRHWSEFGGAHGYRFTAVGWTNMEDPLGSAPRQTADDLLRATYEWGRNRGLDVETTLARAPARVGADSFRRFVGRYVSFKRDKRVVDFNDMLEEALHRGLRPDVKVAFVDEAQDLSPLQVRAVQAWFGHCRQTYVAGDDDQAIYGFQGADPGWLLALSRAHPTTVLAQSYRVPAMVHALAMQLVARNQNRIRKIYMPRQVVGSVDYLPLEAALSQVDGASTTFVLVRNRCYLESVAEQLLAAGVAYVVEGGGAANPLGPQLLAAVRSARAVAYGWNVQADDLKAMLEFIPSNGSSLLPRGTKARAAQLEGELAPSVIKNLLQGGTLLSVATAEGPLGMLKRLDGATKRYLEAIQARHGSLVEPKVRLTTIHGSKGREADTVVLLPEMTRATYMEHLDQRHGGAEAENRVAYVGATRAKERLVIAGATRPLAYRYPHVTGAWSQALGATGST